MEKITGEQQLGRDYMFEFRERYIILCETCKAMFYQSNADPSSNLILSMALRSVISGHKDAYRSPHQVSKLDMKTGKVTQV